MQNPANIQKSQILTVEWLVEGVIIVVAISRFLLLLLVVLLVTVRRQRRFELLATPLTA